MGWHRRCEIKRHPPYVTDRCPVCAARELEYSPLRSVLDAAVIGGLAFAAVRLAAFVVAKLHVMFS